MPRVLALALAVLLPAAAPAQPAPDTKRGDEMIGSEIKVKVGDRVKGGVSIIGALA